MNAYTMNHLNTERINSLNENERHQRQQHEGVAAARFVVSLVAIIAVFLLAAV